MKTNNKKPVKKTEAINHPDYKKLQDELNKTEEKANENWNEVLRARAEMANMQKRAEKDVANAHKYGLEKFIMELLPIVDSMEHGLNSCDEDNELVKKIRHGMQLTIELMLKTLKQHKVEQIDPLGKEFDPELHQAMTMREDTGVKPNTVVEVMQKGYTLNGRLIRPALVVVAKSV
jgi:molecular chaperone GrpE